MGRVTNIERVLLALQAEPGLSDAELRQRAQVNPHQQVNQICRRLEREGRLRRIDRSDGRIGNYLTETGSSARAATSLLVLRSSDTDDPPTPAPASAACATAPPTVNDTLIVLPMFRTEG
jgi:hypothetical protein